MSRPYLQIALLGLCLPLFLLVVPGCDPDDNSFNISENAGYPEEVRTILDQRCSGCHRPNRPDGGGLFMHTYEELLKGYTDGAVVIPYSAEWSHLLLHVNTYDDFDLPQTQPFMPYRELEGGGFAFDSTNKLTREELQVLKDWVDMGAPDSEGNIPWTQRENEANGKVFILNSGSDLVTVVDIETNLIMRNIPVGQSLSPNESPHYIRIAPDKQSFYVTLIESGAVERYSTTDYRFLGRLEVGDQPAHVKLSADGRFGLVTHWVDFAGRRITLFDAQSMTEIDFLEESNFNISNMAHGLHVMSDFSRVYFTANEGNYITRVELSEQGFDRSSIELLPFNPNVPLNTSIYQPYDMVPDANEDYLYVTCQGGRTGDSSMVAKFDTRTDSFVDFLKRADDNPPNALGSRPRILVRDPNANKLYVASASESNPAAQGSWMGCVSVVDLNTFTLERNVYRVGHQPHGLALDPNNNLLYVACENQQGVDPPHHSIDGAGFIGRMTVLDVATWQMRTDLETDVAVFPNGNAIVP